MTSVSIGTGFSASWRATPMSIGSGSAVNGTPTFFLNGLRYDGPHEKGAMLEAVEVALDALASRP